MPNWLFFTIVAVCFALVMLGLVFAWSRWMSRPRPDD